MKTITDDIRASAIASAERKWGSLKPTPDNDPHGEHDFGNFKLCGRTFYFKIDAYDENLEFGSEDPPSQR
jgi:Protein of unknown function (DUF3768)